MGHVGGEFRRVLYLLLEDKGLQPGAGEKAFVAGADISEFTSVNEMNARKLAEEGQEIFQAIDVLFYFLLTFIRIPD